MGDWKLLALDMDGTLLGRDGQISEENRTWIQRAREYGIETTLATGRLYRELVTDAVELLGIRVPVVTSNGGEVWTADGTLLEQYPIPQEDVEQLLQLAEEYRIRYWASPSRGVPIHPETLPDSYRSMTWLKFGFYTESPEVTLAVRGRLESMGRFEVTNSSPLNIEVNPKGVSKASGLATVCRSCGIRPAQVIAIGDSLNDIAMLHYVGLGIAMGNAQDEVKRVARRVTTDHDHHGVARAIEQVLDSIHRLG